jgi:peptide/nickel transport system substrate-binding protein
MMKTLLKRTSVAAILAATMAFASYGLPGTSAFAASDGNTAVVIGARIVPETIDPAHASNANNDFYIAALYDRLVRFSPDGKLEPALATEWKYAADAKSLTLTIRGDAVFHSGNKLTAKDVAYSLDRLAAIGAGSGGLIADYDGSDVSGDQITIRLKRPNLNFLGALSTIYVVDSQVVSQQEGSDHGQRWLSTNEAGSGAYTLKTYNANQQVQFARFDKHWSKTEARPTELTIRIITEASAIRDELRAGGIDLGVGVPAIDLQAFESDANFTVQSLPSTRVTIGAMNMQGKVTSDPRVREAIQLAYDQKGHLKAALGGYGQIATSLVPAAMACRVTIEPYAPDLERAKKLVADAGAAGATLRIAYQPVIPEQRVAGTLLEANLRQIGFNVEVTPVTYSQYLGLIKSADTAPDVAILWDLAPYPSIGPMLARTWGGDRVGVSNFALYANAEVDKLLADGLSQTDPEKACKDYEQAQAQIIKDRPAIVIAYPAVVQVYDKRIAAIPYSPVAPTFDLSLLTLAK